MVYDTACRCNVENDKAYTLLWIYLSNIHYKWFNIYLKIFQILRQHFFDVTCISGCSVVQYIFLRVCISLLTSIKIRKFFLSLDKTKQMTRWQFIPVQKSNLVSMQTDFRKINAKEKISQLDKKHYVIQMAKKHMWILPSKKVYAYPRREIAKKFRKRLSQK